MTTWTTIFPETDGSPVRGEPDEFQLAANFFDNMAEQSQRMVDEFGRFARGGESVDKLEGEAARAFSRFVDDVDDTLQELPRVSREAGAIFEDHLAELRRLRQWAELATDSALARARTAWNRKQDLEADRDRLASSRASIAGQIRELEPVADGTTDADLERLHRNRGRTESQLRSTEGELSRVDATLDGILDEWREIRAAEDARDESTRTGMEGIDLGDLNDPGFWDRVVNFAGGLVNYLGDVAMVMFPGLALIALALEGDWAALVWELKERLDTVLMVAGIVALFFPLTAPFVVAILALSALALAINVGLYATQTANPRTGETVGLGEVAFSALGVALSVGGGVQAFRAASGMSSSFTPATSLQSLADDAVGLHTVATGGSNSAASAASLGIHIVPMHPSTPFLTGLGGIARKPTGAFALFRLGYNTHGAIDTFTGMKDIDGAIVDAQHVARPWQAPSTDVFTEIAHRRRFERGFSWQHGFLPGGAELHIVPAN